MKKNILLIILALITIQTSNSQSTFRAEALNNAIINWVNNQVQKKCDIKVITKLTDVKLRQTGVKAKIEAKNEIIGENNIDLVFYDAKKEIFRKNIRIKVQIDFESNIFIKKNDAVKLFLYSSGILIKTDGIALEDGNVGEIIKTKNNNKQIFYGLIADDGAIIIDKNYKQLSNNNRDNQIME